MSLQELEDFLSLWRHQEERRDDRGNQRFPGVQPCAGGTTPNPQITLLVPRPRFTDEETKALTDEATACDTVGGTLGSATPEAFSARSQGSRKLTGQR